MKAWFHFGKYDFNKSIYVWHSGLQVAWICYNLEPTSIYNIYILHIDRGGGTSEALKLKLHLNSEVYKGDLYNDFG